MMTFCFLTVRSGVGDLLRHSFYLSSRDSPLVSHFSAGTAQKSLGPLYPTVLSHCRLPSRRWDCFIFHGCVVSFLARISGSKDPQVQPPESLVMVRTARTWSNRDPALYLVVIPVLCAGILIHDMVETLTSVKIDCAVSLAHFLGSVCCLGL